MTQGRSQKFAQGGADAQKGKHQSHKRANINFAWKANGQGIRDQRTKRLKCYKKEVNKAIRGQTPVESKETACLRHAEDVRGQHGRIKRTKKLRAPEARSGQ